jgi:serine/threonine protein kinase
MESILNHEKEPGKTINLDQVYETVRNVLYEGQIFLKGEEKPAGEESYQLLETLGKSENGYHFRASVKNEYAVLRMSYREDDYEKQLKTLIQETGNEYNPYYLALREAPFVVRSLSIREGSEIQTVFLDNRVYVRTWEGGAGLRDKIDDNYNNKFKWYKQFLKGLSLIHAKGRVHLDINLDNLFLVNDRLKIGYFDILPGIKELENQKPQPRGTPGHIAPEMFFDMDPIAQPVDIFSAGTAFAQLFLGNEFTLPSTHKPEPLPNVEEEMEFKKLIEGKSFPTWPINKQELFKENYRVFSLLKKEIEKKLKLLTIEPKDSTSMPYAEKQKREEKIKLYRLLLNMMEIDPGNRIKLHGSNWIDAIFDKIFIPDLLIGRELRGRYRLTNIIDSGGRGIIYKAYDRMEEMEKAIKLFPPRYNLSNKDVDAIREELKNTRQAAHRCVVKVDIFDKDGNLNFIVMEYIKGENLEKKLKVKPGERFGEEEALAIMKQVLYALMEAHEAAVTHNALKPKNIMITDDGKVKLLNFGWDYQLKKALERFTGSILGTHDWYHLPPEMYPDDWQRNPQADIWGFGVTLFQLLTGQLPYASEYQTRTQDKPAQDIMGISANTRAVLLKCLKKNKQDRYQSINELYNDLFEKKPTAPTPGIEHEPPPHKQQEIQDNQVLPAEDTGIQNKKKDQPNTSGKFKLFKTKKFIMIIIATAAIIAAVAGYFYLTGPGRAPYRMWYTCKPGQQEATGGGIGIAYSSNGIKWKRYSKNPIIQLEHTEQLKGFQPANSYIVQDNSVYHMIFSLEKPGEPTAQAKIGYASSTDGIHWQIPAYNPVTLDPENIASPGPIIYRNQKFHMWYTRGGEIYYAAADAGAFILNLKKVGNTPVLKRGNPGQWDEDAVEPGTVIFDTADSCFKMWYTGKSNNSNKIGYATSTDGIQWVKYSHNPVYDDELADREMYPAVVKDQEGFKMYYTAASQESDYFPIRLATSIDGITWRKYSNLPILAGGEQEWEKNRIFVTAVYFND